MKKSQILLICILLISAFVVASCGSNCEKAKTEEAKVECNHDHKKSHDCDQAKKDSCKHAQAADTLGCDHEKKAEHKHGEDCEH